MEKIYLLAQKLYLDVITVSWTQVFGYWREKLTLEEDRHTI